MTLEPLKRPWFECALSLLHTAWWVQPQRAQPGVGVGGSQYLPFLSVAMIMAVVYTATSSSWSRARPRLGTELSGKATSPLTKDSESHTQHLRKRVKGKLY